ncbi:ATP-binding cassette sub-family G member 4-like [Oppia nitens]|uniref:ATP-binding cassette sub-family G member 4-like n=1 Tax=Oppia nitens TaxID=1686743 RepID=UPI0023DBCD7F|nr:ATP-binding cassette sub-family G member 4-like [Oppia nitens]
MGPSGSGKTTLLKCLSAQNDYSLDTESKIYIKNSKHKSCFIVQDISEHILSSLTVRQTLLYASKLKNSLIKETLDHNLIVDSLMTELGIDDIRHNSVDTCSGGQQKRIVIACELTSHIKPDLMLIDEPTSGLDSSAAQVIISHMKQLCRKHQITIITSIHQPNYELFNMFDNIYVLGKDGHDLYLGQPQHLKQYLTDLNISCDDNQVSHEVLLKIASDVNHNNFRELQLYYKNNNSLPLDDNLKQMKSIINMRKQFHTIDIFYLLMRSLSYLFRHLYSVLILEIILYILFSVILKFNFKQEITEPNGCRDPNALIDSNNFIAFRELHYILQLASELSFIRITFECILISIYGNCADGQVSSILEICDNCFDSLQDKTSINFE